MVLVGEPPPTFKKFSQERVATLGFRGTRRLPKGSWAFWGSVWALGARAWDLTTRVQEH